MVFAREPAAEYARSSFYQRAGSAFYASDDKLRGDYSPVRYTREINLLHRFSPRGRVLDVGCSTGGFLYYLRERFPTEYRVTGTDVAASALDIAESKGVPIIRQNFLEFGEAREKYDAITFWAVLEHVLNPGDFLRQAAKMVTSGGFCFALAPNIESLAVRLLRAKYRYILPQHLNYFSRATLEKLMSDCAFQVVHSTTMHFNPIVIVQDFRSKTGLVADEQRAALLVKTNSLKRNPLLSPARAVYAGVERLMGKLGLADNVVVIGRKL